MSIGLVNRDLGRVWKLQRSYLFDVQFPDVGSGAGSDLTELCCDVSFGGYNIAEIMTLRHGGFQANFAGFMNIEVAEFKFLHSIPDSVTKYFAAWRDLIVDQNGYYFPKMNYSKRVIITAYDADGTVNGKFTLERAFPVKFPAYNMSYKAEEIHTLSVTLKHDKLLIE